MPIVTSGQVNLAALQTDDVYLVIVPPQTPLIPGFPTDGVGLVGAASRGKPNTPILVGSPQQLIQNFGPIGGTGIIGTVHPNDLVTGAMSCLKQGAANLWLVRVTDGTDVAATKKGLDQAGANLLEFDASSTGAWANGVVVTIGTASNNTVTNVATGTVTLAGTNWAAADTVTATIFGTAVVYTVTATDVAASTQINSIATNLALAINNNTAINLTVTATASAGVVTITSTTKGVAGNSITLAAAKSSAGSGDTATASGATLTGATATTAQSYKVVITSPLDPTEIFDNVTVPATTLGAVNALSGLASAPGTAAAAIVNAISNGISGIRGPSIIITAKVGGAGNSTSSLPVNGAYTLAGGTNGSMSSAGVSTITTNMLLGTDGLPGGTRTGMYALRGTPIFQFGICGLRDSTSWTTQIAFAVSASFAVSLGVPTGTDSQSAVNNKLTLGVDDFHAFMAKDDFWLNDTYNGQIRLVDPHIVLCGRVAALSPELSPSNKPVFGFLGTERTGFFASNGVFVPNTPYSSAEIGLLETGGILFATQPSIGGNYLGFRHGQNTSSNSTTNGVNYTRMTLFLARSLQGAMGFVIGQTHTPTLRRQVISSISQFLGSLADPGPGRPPMIGDVNGGPAFSIVCDQTNNPNNLVALGYMYCYTQVKYLSIVRWFILSLEGGQSVTVRVSTSPVVTPTTAQAA